MEFLRKRKIRHLPEKMPGFLPRKEFYMEKPFIDILKQKVLDREALSKEEALLLVTADLTALSQAADEIRCRYMGWNFDMCSVFSIKGGHCSENCSFCSQSSISGADVKPFPLKDSDEILADAKLRSQQGLRHFCLVSAGRRLGNGEVDKLCETISRIRQETTLLPCVSGGLLTLPQLLRLKEAGLVMLHNNLESSQSFFRGLCSSHTYEDKLETISNAKAAGLQVCCGGLFGLGESWEDRIDLALTIRSLQVQSVPINLLDPVPGTPMGNRPVLKEEEVRRIVSIFRFLLPECYIRLAAGRDYLKDTGLACFRAGSNAAITGDLLTVMGVSVPTDLQSVQAIGYRLGIGC
jgi:biotin synthase